MADTPHDTPELSCPRCGDPLTDDRFEAAMTLYPDLRQPRIVVDCPGCEVVLEIAFITTGRKEGEDLEVWVEDRECSCTGK